MDSSGNLTSATLKNSLRKTYLERFRSVDPVSVPFTFDTEERWVDLTLKLDDETTSTKDLEDLLKNAFSKEKMLVIEGDPGAGKTSLLQRIAFEWAQNEPHMVQYDLVFYAEFRRVREEQFTIIIDLVTHAIRGYLNEQDCKELAQLLADEKYCKERPVLILLDGYDESSLKKQCQQLTEYMYSSDKDRPLFFNIIVTSRKGYLSELREQEGRFTFADLLGFTTTAQKEEYIKKHFTAKDGIQSTERINTVHTLLETNENLKKLSDTPLLLNFICRAYRKIREGAELELYMNTIWWLLDRYQSDDRDRDVPSLFGYQYNDSEEKYYRIENNYREFPLLHTIGRMAMEDIFKTTFTEEDLKQFEICETIPLGAGFLKKESMIDEPFHMETEYSFPHRTIQEFLTAFAFFYSKEEPPEHFWLNFIYPWKNMGRGIVQEKLQLFLHTVSNSSLNIDSSRKKKYSEIIEQSKYCDKTVNPKESRGNQGSTDYVIDQIPKSSEKALLILKKEADQKNAQAYYSLGQIYYHGILVEKNYEEAVRWYTKAAECGIAVAQLNLGVCYEYGHGVDQSYEEAVKWYIKAAEQDLTQAQFQLGLCYEKGHGVAKSNEEAIKWYAKAAEQDNIRAQCKLALIYENGVDQSDKEAVRWWRKAAEQGDADAQYKLAIMHYDGNRVDQSYEEAEKWFTKAAERGHAGAQFHLAVMCYWNETALLSYRDEMKLHRKAAEQGYAYAQFNLALLYDKYESYEKAFKWYTKAAEQGLPDAQNNLGFYYQYGRGVDQSDEEALKWYTKAAEQDLAEAQYQLGIIYEHGQGVGQSKEEADKWYTKALEQGHARCQSNMGFCFEPGQGVSRSYHFMTFWIRSAEEGDAGCQASLGEMYENGQGIAQSYEEAEKWYKKAAEKGNLYVENCLRILHDKKQSSVPQSDKEAFPWYKKLAEQGNADAQYKLGFMYYGQRGVPRSHEEAVKWYRKAAEQGHAEAQCNLANMYRSGEGVPQSDEEAAKWYKKAADQGHTKAQLILQDDERLKSIIESLTVSSEECKSEIAEEIRDDHSN